MIHPRCRRPTHSLSSLRPSAGEESREESRLVLQIHDELLFEVPGGEMDDAVELVRREMCAAYELDPELGVGVGVGKDWLEAK